MSDDEALGQAYRTVIAEVPTTGHVDPALARATAHRRRYRRRVVATAVAVAALIVGVFVVMPRFQDAGSVIAAPSPTTVTTASDPGRAAVHVLVSDPTTASRLALLSGELTEVGGCLGVSDSAVVWPPGTSVETINPLRISIPNLGSYGLGDRVELGGGNVSRPKSTSPKEWKVGTVEIPQPCGESVFVAGPAGSAPTSSAPTSPATSRPVEPDANLMTVEPSVVAPGSLLTLSFPAKSLRGVAFKLESRQGTSWRLEYYLIAGRGGKDPGSNSQFRAGSPDVAWTDIGIGGPGGERIAIPKDVRAGEYQLCTANAPTPMCAPFTVT